MALKKSSNLKKKELNAQIESMQMEIRKRHSDELSAILSQQFESSEINVAVEKVLEDESVEAVDLERKPNKSKRRRDKKAHEFAESRREAAEEALLLPNMKDIEDKKMSDLAAKINCFVSPIAADGHCLYSAVCRQLLITTGENLNYRDLRKVTATYLMEHSEDFIPFLVNDKGNSLSAVEFSQYCNDCEYKAVWGGQSEVPVSLISDPGDVSGTAKNYTGHAN